MAKSKNKPLPSISGTIRETVKKKDIVSNKQSVEDEPFIPSKNIKEFFTQCFKEDKDFHQALAIIGVEGKAIWTELEENLRKA